MKKRMCMDTLIFSFSALTLTAARAKLRLEQERRPQFDVWLAGLLGFFIA
jgi:hypothetical protein